MIKIIPYFNGVVTLTENVFNFLGYLPKDQFSELNAWSVKWRTRFGNCQAVIGIALCAFAFLYEALSTHTGPKKYLTLSQQALSLGILYFNHGLYNIFRAYLEGKGFGPMTAAYDFYGRKLLPPLAESFDLQGILYEKIRDQLNCLVSCQLFPPHLLTRSY
jgi:hypothetical protein